MTDLDIDAIQEKIGLEAKNKSLKLIKKNKSEINRLKKLMSDSLCDNNFYSYKYALEKLRIIYKQPFTDEIILEMWNTSRKTLYDIIAGNYDSKN